MNKILTLFDYQKQFASEDDCFDYLFHLRWPNGFICLRCGSTEYYMIYRFKRFQCTQCRHQTSVTAGTVFHKLRQPLQTLFLAVYLIATSKKGLSPMELQRKLGIKTYKTAWLLMQKIRKAMASSGSSLLTGIVEIDETYIGGHREGTRGRGAEDKNIVGIAVETTGSTMGRAYLKILDSLKRPDIEQFVKDHVTTGTTINTDCFKSYCSFNNEFNHIPLNVSNKSDMLPKVHIVVANLKMWLRGTYNRLPSKHLQRYLDEFTFRFNRRWNLENIFDKLLIRCVCTNTITYAELTG